MALSRQSCLDWIKFDLLEVRDYAIAAGLDHHFIAEIDHLIQTAMANMEEK